MKAAADDTLDSVDAEVELGLLRESKQTLLTERELNSPQNVLKSRGEHQLNKKSLKSDLKKTTAFVKKIKNITTEGIQQCVRDTETLNLNLYISEIVTAILEINFKATEVPMITKLSVCLHRRYEEFTDPLIMGLKSNIFTSDGNGDPKKKRIQIRLLIELFNVGIFLEEQFFIQIIRYLLGKRKTTNAAENEIIAKVAIHKKNADLQGFSVFMKYGCESLLGYAPMSMVQLSLACDNTALSLREPHPDAEEVTEDISKFLANRVLSSTSPIKIFVSTLEHVITMRNLVLAAYGQLVADLFKAHKDLKKMKKRFEKDKLIHGQLTEVKQTELDQMQKFYEVSSQRTTCVLLALISTIHCTNKCSSSSMSFPLIIIAI